MDNIQIKFSFVDDVIIITQLQKYSHICVHRVTEHLEIHLGHFISVHILIWSSGGRAHYARSLTRISKIIYSISIIQLHDSCVSLHSQLKPFYISICKKKI